MKRKVSLALLLLIVSFSGWYLVKSKTGKKEADFSSPVSKISSQENAIAQEKEEKAYSVDGEQFITLKKNATVNETEYVVVLSDGTEIFRETEDINSKISLPGNSWDPGNEYVFLERVRNGGKSDILLKTSGESFSDSEKALDVGMLFNEKKFPFQFKEATGWAGANLLVVKTLNEDKTDGPLYWFEVSSGAFIQLY